MYSSAVQFLVARSILTTHVTGNLTCLTDVPWTQCGGAFVARPKNIKSFMRSTAVTTTQIKSHLQRHRQRLLNQGGGAPEAPSQGGAQRPLSASQGGIGR